MQALDVTVGSTYVLFCLSLIAAMTGADDRYRSVERRVLSAGGHCSQPLICLNLFAAVTGAHDRSWSVERRFWVLEVVARMPYFAYISMLHLYESLGWWRAGAELRRVGFCLSVCLSVGLSVCLSAQLAVWLAGCV